jgi:NAD(P)-dependent dehydrogenase (short-subunit alcohol dehydrogenase family)
VSTRSGPFDAPGTALVQGASGGIGAALVEQLLARPEVTAVVATSRAPGACATLTRLAETHGERLVLLQLDVEHEESIADAARNFSALALADPLRLVVNCAGLLHDDTLQPEKRLEELNGADLARLFAVNATGPMLMARYFHASLARRGRSVFASISARVGSIGDNRLGGWYGYRASKAAQNMFTRTLAIELARRNPECICAGLHPGTVDTALSAPFRRGVDPEKLFTPARAAGHLMSVMAGLEAGDSGGCFAWDGRRIVP